MSDFIERHRSYRDAYDYKIIGRLPILVRTDIRSGHRLLSKLERPYSNRFINLMANTMLQTISEIDGAIFGYHFADEITYVLIPGDEPWFDNRIQKLSSIISSLTSVNFFKFMLADNLELDGDVIFDAQVFAVPSLNEVINNLILQQQDCMQGAISLASQSELSKIKGQESAAHYLYGKKTEEKMKLLYSQCDIDFENYYPISYKRGVCAYKTPKIYKSKDGNITRNKWFLDFETPTFVLDRNFVSNILVNGHDIFRAERDLITNN